MSAADVAQLIGWLDAGGDSADYAISDVDEQLSRQRDAVRG